VAFDGLDSELVEEFDLENVVLEETGMIDNHTGIFERNTSELFTSFITGKTWEQHGVKSLRKDCVESPKAVSKFEDKIQDKKIGKKTSGLRKALYENINSINYTRRKWLRTDYSQETIFDKVGGLPLFVPASRNPPNSFLAGMPHSLVDKGLTVEEAVEAGHEDTQCRLNRLDDVSHEFWDLVMLHVHEPDAAQDLEYSDLESEYQRIDEIAGDIREKYGGEYDVLVFVSDHGRSIGVEHNKNAFYSSSQPLFDDEKPHITDFHDRFLQLTGGAA
jgi:hypothetical protein